MNRIGRPSVRAVWCPGGRVAEHVGAVAQGRDDERIGRRELRADRGADAPAEPARRRRAEIGPRPGERRVAQNERIFVDDDRILVLGIADAMRRPGGIDRRHAARFRQLALGAGARAFACFRDARPPCPKSCVADAVAECRRELGKHDARRAGYRDIARKAADRGAREQRIDADMDHLAMIGGIAVHGRDPRHVGLDHQDRVGLSLDAARDRIRAASDGWSGPNSRASGTR